MLIDNTHEVLTDDLLKKAFNDYFDRVLEQTPSDEELAKKYPYPESSYEKVFAAYKAQKRRALIWLKTIGRVAIIVIVAVSLTFGVLMTNTDIKASVSSFFIRDKGDHWQIDFNNGEEYAAEIEEESPDSEKEITVLDYKIGYIPDGFELTREEIFVDVFFYNEYWDDNGRSITIEIYTSGNSAFFVDNDRHKHSFTKINGCEAMISYDDGGKHGIIIIADGKNCISVDGFLEKEELIKIAENITKQGAKDYKESPLNKFEIRYIPEGFKLGKQTYIDKTAGYEYIDSNGDRITINICRREDLENQDYLTYKNMQAGPFIGYYKELDDGKSRLLVMERSDYAVFVETTLDVEALKKIARNIREIIDFESEEYKNSPVYKFEIGYIPKGFELDLDLYRPNSLRLSYYKNGTIPLSISITKKGTATYGVDSERTTHSLLTVNGQEAQMWYNYKEGTGILLVAYEECVVKVFACDTPEEIIKIAENIKPKAPK